MRVFVFAIGGTGSRVLTSLVMQLAAGVRPKDSAGNPIRDLSIVPIIVDPHEDNSGLQQLSELLSDYRKMHQRIHGDALNEDGFFGVKIETLKDIGPDSGVADKFFFKMQSVTDSRFDKFIGLNDMDNFSTKANKLFAKMLFSKEELETEMKEGFYGSPNIGCVALNEFKESDDFMAFRSAYSEGDRLFFIGSIFGGTGASGLPLFISSIRDLQHIDNEDSGKSNCSKAPIGALVVMPYFSIAQDVNSPINENDFIIKTRSALRYYDTSLNKYINKIYYIADPKGTADFVNDPGNVNNQQSNKYHIVEFAGALSIFDFCAEDDVDVDLDSQGRMVAQGSNSARCKAYRLRTEDGSVNFEGLADQTNQLVMLPFMKFYMLRNFMYKELPNMLDKPFAKTQSPKIERSVYDNRDLKDFFTKFDQWLKEIKDQGANAHNLDLFCAIGNDYTLAFKGKPGTKKGFLGGRKSVNAKDLQLALDKASQQIGNMDSMEKRWFTIANDAFMEVIANNYEYQILL